MKTGVLVVARWRDVPDTGVIIQPAALTPLSREGTCENLGQAWNPFIVLNNVLIET